MPQTESEKNNTPHCPQFGRGLNLARLEIISMSIPFANSQPWLASSYRVHSDASNGFVHQYNHPAEIQL